MGLIDSIAMCHHLTEEQLDELSETERAALLEAHDAAELEEAFAERERDAAGA